MKISTLTCLLLIAVLFVLSIPYLMAQAAPEPVPSPQTQAINIGSPTDFSSTVMGWIVAITGIVTALGTLFALIMSKIASVKESLNTLTGQVKDHGNRINDIAMATPAQPVVIPPKTLVLLFLPALLCFGCAELTSDISKVQAWNSSPTGIVTLNTVGAIASTFGPQYAAPISIGISSLETGKLPTVADTQSILASVNQGNPNATQAKIAKLAVAVVAAAQSAPSPNTGLVAAANVVTPAAPKAPQVTKAQIRLPQMRETLPALYMPHWDPVPEPRPSLIQI